MTVSASATVRVRCAAGRRVGGTRIRAARIRAASIRAASICASRVRASRIRASRITADAIDPSICACGALGATTVCAAGEGGERE